MRRTFNLKPIWECLLLFSKKYITYWSWYCIDVSVVVFILLDWIFSICQIFSIDQNISQVPTLMLCSTAFQLVISSQMIFNHFFQLNRSNGIGKDASISCEWKLFYFQLEINIYISLNDKLTTRIFEILNRSVQRPLQNILLLWNR